MDKQKKLEIENNRLHKRIDALKKGIIKKTGDAVEMEWEKNHIEIQYKDESKKSHNVFSVLAKLARELPDNIIENEFEARDKIYFKYVN